MIYRYCMKCRHSNKTTDKLCRKCGSSLGAKYRVIVKDKGRRVSRSVDSLSRAKEIDTVIKSDLIRGEFKLSDHRIKKVVTLDHIWNKYFEQIKLSKKSWKTDHCLYMKYIQPALGATELSRISPIDIERLKHSFKGDSFRGTKYAPATVKHVLVILNRLFNVAIQWGKFHEINPVTKVSMPKIDNEVVRFLTPGQLDSLHTVLDMWPEQSDADVVRFLLFSGCRRGEAFSLQWQSVDLANKVITLTAPKGGKTESIPVNDEVIKILKAADRTASPFVFPGKNGERMKAVNCWLKIKKAAKLPEAFRLHDLRHNFASSLVSNGVDLYTISRLLTHKTPSITKKYAHLSDDALRAAAERAGELVAKKSVVLCNTGTDG